MSVVRLLLVSALLTLSCVTPAQQLRVDGMRLTDTWRQLRAYGLNENGGSDRVAYSQANKDALKFLQAAMGEAGLNAYIDVAGNLVGRRAGNASGRAPIVTGSHIDTVPNGGHYDGVVGALAGIEVARSLHDAGYQLEHPLEVIVWSNEEGGKTGSRSVNGSVTPEEMLLPSLGDKTLGLGMTYLGGNPARLAENIRQAGEVAALIELHVEQGAILDREGKSIGIVEGIVGIKRWNVSIEGFANHAGTTPMGQRSDALTVTAQLITAINEIMTRTPGRQVGTVGRIQAYPGAPNVVPGEVTMSLEIRDLDMQKIDRLFQRVSAAAQKLAHGTATNVSFAQFYESPAAITDARFQRLISGVAKELQLATLSMPSGAGHDAQSLRGIAPLGMIFVPSVDGVSHAPTEFTREDDVINGANVLLQTIIEVDKLLN